MSLKQEGVFVLHINNSKEDNLRENKASLEEAINLAQAINLEVRAAQIINLHKMNPSTLLGKGNVERLQGEIQALNYPVVFCNTTLSPIQQRNLERAWKAKVIDRTGLIIEIFGERARTAEGKLQVALASLRYQKSRLVRTWTHLERQRGSLGFIGGPGESQLELDRRMIDQRILKIEKELKQVIRTRSLHRKARSHLPTIALVGYTNSGKSTLFNRLTQSKVFAKDLLFATLDPTMRKIRLPGEKDAILSDTVGFISELPTTLVAAFQATLEEVCHAQLIIHVRDISHPDTQAQYEDVMAVLKELGVGETPILEAYNKIDQLTDEQRAFYKEVSKRPPFPALISALHGEGIPTFLEKISKILNESKLADKHY